MLLTFLIADVRGYPQFTNEQGVPAAARLADRFAVLCRAIVSRHGGEVIELAAARIRLFPPKALLRRLSPRLPLLTGGAK